MIAKDKHYYYKGNEYVVVGFTKMKSTLDGTWVEAVQYKRATEVDDPNVEPFTREKSDFEYKFIPAVLEVDMEIVAVSMGKLVAEYKVTEVGEDNATAISPSDVLSDEDRLRNCWLECRGSETDILEGYRRLQA